MAKEQPNQPLSEYRSAIFTSQRSLPHDQPPEADDESSLDVHAPHPTTTRSGSAWPQPGQLHDVPGIPLSEGSATLGAIDRNALLVQDQPPTSVSSTMFSTQDPNSPAKSSISNSTQPVSVAGLGSTPDHPLASLSATKEDAGTKEGNKHFVPVNSGLSKAARPNLQSVGPRIVTEDDLFRSVTTGKLQQTKTQGSHTLDTDEQHEIQRLMSKMFGQNRRNQSEDEKTRHAGVVFKNLNVVGLGLGAAVQATASGPFLAIPRLLKHLVTRSGGNAGAKTKRTLISHFHGCVRPGEMLLVLGRPGAGCSTFLKVFGNQRSGYESVDGEVTYGGASAAEMEKNYRGEILYNPEEDIHYATLSVKETLQFALKTRTPGKASRNEGETRSQYAKEFLRVVTKLFWIEHTLNTKVGDAFIRGVSGGEKKRVSIAEAMITKASVQAWDNSTRGLDASTALEYVQSLRALTNMARTSTAIALYQAGETLYDLFDKVLLIDSGRCLYYGRSDEAATYFEGLGFERPPRWTTADFLTSISDKHERRIREGAEANIPRTAEQLEDTYFKSEAYASNLADISNFESHLDEQRGERQRATSKATKTKNYALPFYKQVTACTSRQFFVMLGDKQSLGGKWGGVLFQALIVGSLFYKMPATSAGIFTRGGVLFFMLLFNALLALAELTSAFSSRPIMLKHKSFSFCRPAAFAIAQTVVDMPLVFVQVFIFDIVVYFMSGLARTPSQFFTNLFILWTITMTMYAFFRSMGSLVSSLDVATRVTGVSIQALIVYTGYLIPPTSMRPWLGWLRYINPVAYAFEALMANEFYDLDLQCTPPSLVPEGLAAMPKHQSCLVKGSQPGSTVVQGELYIEAAFSYTWSHLWRNVGIIYAFLAFFILLTMVGMERQKPNAAGRAITVFRRGQAPQSVRKAMEKGEETKDEEKLASEGPVGLEDDSGDSTSSSRKPVGVAKNETTFTWQSVNYTIPTSDGEKVLLNDVQGFVRPGKLTALMGASGAGKTTLLTALGQRISFGVVTGDFLVDGKPLPESFQRATGFAEQQDVHEPTATVREALRFSALLRRAKEVPLQEKYDYCETIIDLLEMRDLAGATIGEIGSGLNQEQRKRLTIGVELASKPELLMFLDEPTSGLDSNAASNIVRFLQKLAGAGQAILCTIHQPSSVLFEHFDELILLKSGGRVVYHGELGADSRTLIDYFESHGAKRCPAKANPAEYMLEVIGAGDPNYQGSDWGDIWAQSSQSQDRSHEIADIIAYHSANAGSGAKQIIQDDREFAMPVATQVWAVTARNFTSVWRSPNYLIGKFMLHIITGLFNCFTFYRPGNSSTEMQNRLFSIFLTLTICPPLIQQLQPRFLKSRQIFATRERGAKIYSWLAFVVAAISIEIPYSLLAGTIYFCCWWFGSVGNPYTTGRDSFDGAFAWLLTMQFEMWYVSFGQALASIAPNELLASLLVPIAFTFVVAFCGVVVPYQALPEFWRSWMYPLSPFRYLLEAYLGAVSHGVQIQCTQQELAHFSPPVGMTCLEYTRAFLQEAGGYVQTGADGMCEFCQYATGDQYIAGINAYWGNRWRDFGIFWAFILFNFAVVFVASYLYLEGGKKLKKSFARKKQLKASKQERK